MNNDAAIINLYDKISSLHEEVAALRLRIIELQDSITDSDEMLQQHDLELEAISEVVFVAVSAEEQYS